MPLARLLFRNLTRRRTRSALTIGAVVLAVMLHLVLSSLLAAFEFDDETGVASTRIVVQHASGFANLLPVAYAGSIGSLPGVGAVAPQLLFAGTYIDDRPEHFFGQLSTDPSAWREIFADYEISPEDFDRWQGQRDSFIAGRQLVERFGWARGDRIRIQGSYIPITLDLVLAGVYEGRDEAVAFFHNEYLATSWVAEQGFTGLYYLRVSSRSDVDPVVAEINGLFENSAAPVRAMPEKQFMRQFVDAIGNVKLMVRTISFSMLATVAMIVATAIAIGSRERAVEIAVLRVLGFMPRDIFALVFGESIALAAIGGALGLLIGHPAAIALGRALEHSPAAAFAYNFHVPAAATASGFLAAIVIGTVAGLVPAMRSARVSIVDGLRLVV